MKKTILFSACAALSLSMVACGGNPNKAKNAEAAAETKAEAKAAPVYNVIDKPQVDGRFFCLAVDLQRHTALLPLLRRDS